ncbi:MAG: hypothetical protein QF704_01805 [Anaerolineales bacterium]|nr:hypothetical protein [Anaerolineales bacterium]
MSVLAYFRKVHGEVLTEIVPDMPVVDKGKELSGSEHTINPDAGSAKSTSFALMFPVVIMPRFIAVTLDPRLSVLASFLENPKSVAADAETNALSSIRGSNELKLIFGPPFVVTTSVRSAPKPK